MSALAVYSPAHGYARSVGITREDVGIRVNSRKVLGSVLEASGVPKEQCAGPFPSGP